MNKQLKRSWRGEKDKGKKETKVVKRTGGTNRNYSFKLLFKCK